MSLVGFRTIIVGLLITIGVPALTYLSGVDWTALGVSPIVASVITSVIFLAMRLLTKTPVFKPNSVASVAAMPDVVKVLTTADAAGRALADSVPSDKVLPVANPNMAQGVGRRAS